MTGFYYARIAVLLLLNQNDLSCYKTIYILKFEKVLLWIFLCNILVQ